MLKIIGAIILVFLFLEFAVRILIKPDITPVIGELDTVLGYKLRLNSISIHRTKEFDTIVKINSRGLRSDEIPYKKIWNETRIMFLGDSFTYGWGVNKEERFTEIITNKTRFSVINAGIPGYRLSNMLAFFENEGYRYSPNILIVMYAPDTGLANINTAQYEVINNTLVRTPLLIKTEKNQFKKIVNLIPGYSFLSQKFQLFILIRNSIINFLNQQSLKGKVWDCSSLKLGWDAKTKQLEILILQEFERIANKEGIPLIVVVRPNSVCDTDLGNELKIFLQNTLVIDLKPYFLNSSKDYYYSYDKHWNKAGHELAAETLIRYFDKLGFYQS